MTQASSSAEGATWQAWTATHVTLLCWLHYAAPARLDGLRKHEEECQSFEELLESQVGARPSKELRRALQQLTAEDLVACLNDQWSLTKRGRTVAYNLCELEIQLHSGFWKAIAGYLPSRRKFRHLLDVGGAAGLSAIPASSAGIVAADGVYMALDVDRQALLEGATLGRRYRGRHTLARPIAADARRLPFGDQSVDCLISRTTLYYLQKHEVLCEMARVLEKDGILVVSVPTIGYMARRAFQSLGNLRLREATKFAFAVTLGAIAWMGFDIKPPEGTFIGETERGLRTQLSKVPDLKVVHLARAPLRFLGNPLVLLAQKSHT